VKAVWAWPVLLLAAAMGGGCASPSYLSDRARDAADMVTLTVGTGGGAKVRAGPVQVAVIHASDLAGLRAGEFFARGNSLPMNREIYSPLPFFSHGRTPAGMTFGGEAFSLGPASLSSLRGKDVRANSWFPCWAAGEGAAFYTQVEASAGLGLMVRVGFNPGEMLDFLLGWTTADIYGDDLAPSGRTAPAPGTAPAPPARAAGKEGSRP
jgi:hypothetical protein